MTRENESCGNPDCLVCCPLMTRTGKVLTEADLEAWAAEAERGYDVPTFDVQRIARKYS